MSYIEPKRPRAGEKAIRVLECLRRETDSEHPITQKTLREKLSEYYGAHSKDCSNDMINGLARALNFDCNGEPLPEDEWQIVFDAFRQIYGWEYDERDEKVEEDAVEAHSRIPIRNLYYQPIFSYEEIDCMIEAILFSKTLDENIARRIERKIRCNLTSKYYKDTYRSINRVREPMSLNREQLHENIETIRKALENAAKSAFALTPMIGRESVCRWARLMLPVHITSSPTPGITTSSAHQTRKRGGRPECSSGVST